MKLMLGIVTCLLQLMGTSCVSQKVKIPEKVLQQTIVEPQDLLHSDPMDSDEEELFNKYDTNQPVSPDNLSIIHYILSRTYEDNIHKMRGEIDNKVMIADDGREIVINGEGEIVLNIYNQGTYNFGTYEEPVNKFLLDIKPWIKHGNAPDDPTHFPERLYYYTLDLNYGIQSYIFEGYKKTLKRVDYYSLSNEEKLTYHLFNEWIFNPEYKIHLLPNLDRLRDDSDFYFDYFNQIQHYLGFRKD